MKWVSKLDDYRFSPRVDILVRHLAKAGKQRQVQIRDFAKAKNHDKRTVLNWITRPPNRRPILAANLQAELTVNV